MHHIQLRDPEPHDLLEPSSMSYTPQSTQRALIAWTHLGKKNNFQDVCNYYQRLEKLEETLPRQQMMASRMLEYKLIESHPPKSMLQHKLFPNLYPYTREYKPFGEKNVITIKDRAKAREPATAADIQAANKMIKTYCAFRETTPKKLIQEFRQYSMANGVEQTVSNVAYFVQHKMVLVIKQIEAKLNAEKNFNYSGWVDPDVNTEGDEHEEVYDNYGITPEQNSINNGNTAFINSLLDDDDVKTVVPVTEKTIEKSVKSEINSDAEEKPKLSKTVNGVATKASVSPLQYSHVVQNGTKYVAKATAVNKPEAHVNDVNYLHTESTNGFENQMNSKTKTRTNAIAIVNPTSVKKNKKSKGKDTVANNIEKNVTKLIEKFEKVTTNDSVTVKKEVPKITMKNKVSAPDSPQIENCKSVTENNEESTALQGKSIEVSHTRQPLVEITGAINNENSSVEADVIETEVERNESKTETVSQDPQNLSESVQKMSVNLMGVKKYFLEHQMDIDIGQIMKSFFEKRNANKNIEPKFSNEKISQMQEEVDEIYNRILELSHDLQEDQNNNSQEDDSVEQDESKSESVKNRLSAIYDDITKHINKLNISIEKEEMKRMSKKERKAWKKCKRNARKVTANENLRHSTSASVEFNDSSLSFKSLPSENPNRSVQNESIRQTDDDFLFDCEPIIVDPDCSLADTSNLSEDFKSLNRKRFSTSSQ